MHVYIWEDTFKLVNITPYEMMKYSLPLDLNIKFILQQCCSRHIQKMDNNPIFQFKVSKNKISWWAKIRVT